MIRIPVGESGQTIELTEEVLLHLDQHQQKRIWQNEAGGQLFARFIGTRIVIEEATGPRSNDRRGRMSYRPHKPSEQTEIIQRHGRGLHFVGDWHTHPEPHPVPSPSDLASIGESVRRSSHALNGFILVVVGTSQLPESIHVSVHDGRQAFQLLPLPAQSMTDELGRAPVRVRFV